MKPKPRVTKGPEGWMVERPVCGFARPAPEGPFASQAAALASLKIGTGSASASVERAVTPEPYVWWGASNAHRVWPGVIR